MPKAERVSQFLEDFTHWARKRPDIIALALVGSYARGSATQDSDVDLVLITIQPSQYLEDLDWTKLFGDVERSQLEDYGRVTSIRAWYRDGVEVEYGITSPDWAASPLDEGTRWVIAGGMVVLLEKDQLLGLHQPSHTGGKPATLAH